MLCWINRSLSSWSGRPKSNGCWGKLYVLHCGEKSLPGSLGMGARRDWKQSLSISHVFFTDPDSCFFHGADRFGGRSFGGSGCKYVSAGQGLGSACPPGQAFCKLSILPFFFPTLDIPFSPLLMGLAHRSLLKLWNLLFTAWFEFPGSAQKLYSLYSLPKVEE